MPQPKLPSRATVVILTLMALALLAFGILNRLDTVALEKSDKVVDARVTNSRIVTGKRTTTYEVQYSFVPSPGTEAIGRADLLGRKDLWSTIPEEDWNKAVRSLRLAVRVDPAKPGNNAPVAGMPKAIDEYCFIGVGGLLLLFAIYEGIRRSKAS